MAPFEKSMEMMPFKQRKCLATRKDEVCSIRSKFPNKLPVIVERYTREKSLPLLDKTKFLVPFELTLGQFLCLLRNKIDLESTQALFLLVAEKSMSCMSSSMGELYSHYSDPDGFLYITYASQEVFGAPQPAERPPCWSLVHSLNRTELRQIGTNQAGMVSGGFFFLAHTSYLIWTHKQHLCMTWDCTWICLSFFKADCSPGYLPDRMSSGDG